MLEMDEPRKKTEEKKKKEKPYMDDKIPCKICGIPIYATEAFSDEMCDSCWQITSNLENFIKHDKGFEFVRHTLSKNGFVIEDVRAG